MPTTTTTTSTTSNACSNRREAGAAILLIAEKEQEKEEEQEQGETQGTNIVHFQIESAPSWISVASSWIIHTTPSSSSSFSNSNTNRNRNTNTNSNNNVVLTSANHSIIHSHQSIKQQQQRRRRRGASPSSNHHHHHHYDDNYNSNNCNYNDCGPEFGFLRTMLRALLLSTALACCAALDANVECRSIQEIVIYDELTDDAVNDADQSSEWKEELVCQQMFYYVVIPVGMTILVGALLCLWLLRRHLRILQATGSMDRLTRHTQHYATCLQLTVVLFILLLAWTYGTVAIMLRPRVDDNSNAKDNNPYQSLAAVDSMGHVSDNANLYYTCLISLGLSMALLYQIVGDTVRQYRHVRRERMAGAEHVGDVEAMLSSLTAFQLETYRESRAMWYQSLYRLRIRTGIWTATCLGTLCIMASSVHIWREVLIPTAGENVPFRDVCATLTAAAADNYDNSGATNLPPTLCARTSFSLISGMLAACLSFGAIVTHLLARRGAVIDESTTLEQQACAQHLAAFPDTIDPITTNQQKAFDGGGTSFPLRSEFLLAVILSYLLGLNAVFATGVHGPAAAVGNLYYASWISFLLCLRICLGCLEELCDMDQEAPAQSSTKNSTNRQYTNCRVRGYDPPSIAGSESTRQSRWSTDDNSTDLNTNERAQRTRSYIFLGIFSTVCSASAFDAAMNQQGELDIEQRFVILAPSLVAVVCACQFLLCLRTKTYRVVSQIWLGGLLSVLIFAVCMVTLVITMHSESSWAVNAIGEIQMANLYYFTWASIITAGLQMMSYVISYLGITSKPYLTVVWAAVGKVCFAILGAGFHIWHNISDACTFDDITSGAVTFCSRTILAIVVALTGMLVAGFIASSRILFAAGCAESMVRTRAHVELVMSIFLVLLFGAAVAMITGIGGPGQSVGDLFYFTWLAFLISIGLVSACFEEIGRVDLEVERAISLNKDGVLL